MLQMCKAPDVSLRLKFTAVSSRSSLFLYSRRKRKLFSFPLKGHVVSRKCARYFSFSHIGILTSEGRNTMGFLQWSNCSSSLLSLMFCFLQNWGAKWHDYCDQSSYFSTANAWLFVLQSVRISCFIFLETQFNRTWFFCRSWCLRSGQE